MKTLIISHMYPSVLSETNGIFVHQQVKALRHEGCETEVVSPNPWVPLPLVPLSAKWRGYWALPNRSLWDGMEVHYPRFLEFPGALFAASSGIRMYVGIGGLVRRLRRDFRFDIIHANVALPDGFAGMMLKREHKKPLVVTCHGGELYLASQEGGGYRRALTRVFEEADKVVAVSTRLAEIARPFLRVPAKLTVINNGVDAGEAVPPTPDLVARYAGHKVVVSVSYLIKRKGLDVNLCAVSRLSAKYSNLRYLVIGSGPDLPRLEKLTHDLGIESCVEFLGELPHERAMEYMAIADVFSLPSWNEAFGMVYIESAMQGRPVIACEGEGIEDVFGNHDCALFVKPGDVASLARALDSLLENRQKACEMGQKARELVLENYTWRMNAQKYMRIYAALVAGSTVQQGGMC